MSSKSDRDNHANQMNPNNDAYWQSRGEEERPPDWEDEQEASPKPRSAEERHKPHK
ncbi:MAG: hypothetical protein OXS30_13280 [Chloroflexota bacterium]|nr:hypothetical protein [Chloroflexota bacterium]